MTLSQSIPVSGPMIPVVVITFVFIGSLIAGMVMLALRGGRTGKVIAATLAAFIAALVLFAVLLRVYELRSNERAVVPVAGMMPPPPANTVTPPGEAAVWLAPPALPAAASANTLLETATRWLPAAELLPDAAVDLYPSQHDAERAVAAAIAKAYARHNTGGDPVSISLFHPGERTRNDDYKPLANAVRQHGLACRAPQPKIQNHTHQYGVEVELTPATGERPVGRLAARDGHLVSDARAFAVTARFADKPWLTDLASERITRNQHDLIVGISVGPESTEADALTAALRAVALQVAPRLADARPPNTYDPEIRYVMLDSVVRRLRQIDRLNDRFTQRLERPYGTVYRAAVLVNATPEFINELYGGNQHAWTDLPLDQQYAAATSNVASTGPVNPHQTVFGFHEPIANHHPSSAFATTVAARVAGLGMLVVLTLLIYLGLDRWTRGYHPGLATTTALAVLLGGAALLGLLSIA